MIKIKCCYFQLSIQQQIKLNHSTLLIKLQENQFDMVNLSSSFHPYTTITLYIIFKKGERGGLCNTYSLNHVYKNLNSAWFELFQLSHNAGAHFVITF